MTSESANRNDGKNNTRKKSEMKTKHEIKIKAEKSKQKYKAETKTPKEVTYGGVPTVSTSTQPPSLPANFYPIKNDSSGRFLYL